MSTVLSEPSTNGSLAVVNSPTPLVLLQQAIDRGLDADKLSALMDLQERYENRQAEHAFNEAMNQCQNEMPAVVRDATNKQTNSKYARLETVNATIKPTYVKHGFSLSFGTEQSNLEGHIRVTCDVMHSAGHVKHYQADLPLDNAGMQGAVNKTPMHATGSTMSYGRRYLTFLIFNVSLFHHHFGAWLLSESGLLTITDGNREAIANVAALHRCAAAGEEVESAAAWSAESAARSAERSAAWKTIASKGIELLRTSPIVGDCQECPEAACKSLLHLQSTALIREFAISK